MTITGSFRITEIDGEAALGSFELALDDDGRVHGRVVNRFAGGAEQAEGSVTFGALAATRMAGPPELMAQEDALFRALQGTLEVSSADGDVVLTGAGGTVRLSPAAPDDGDALV